MHGLNFRLTLVQAFLRDIGMSNFCSIAVSMLIDDMRESYDVNEYFIRMEKKTSKVIPVSQFKSQRLCSSHLPTKPVLSAKGYYSGVPNACHERFEKEPKLCLLQVGMLPRLQGHVQAMYQAPILHNPERHRTLTVNGKKPRIGWDSNTSWLWTNLDVHLPSP